MSPVSGSVTARAPPASPKQTFSWYSVAAVQIMSSSTVGVSARLSYSALHSEWLASGTTMCLRKGEGVRRGPQPHPVIIPDPRTALARSWPLSGNGMGVTLSFITTGCFSWIRARSLFQSDWFWKPGWRTTCRREMQKFVLKFDVAFSFVFFFHFQAVLPNTE